jgi:hypothetical protein
VSHWFRESLGAAGESPAQAAQAGEQGLLLSDAGVFLAAVNGALDVRRHTRDVREAMRLIESVLRPSRGRGPRGSQSVSGQ